MKINVIILAGGVGNRMGAPMPKQFLSLNDKPVIVHTILNFQKNDRINDIVIVCVKDWIPQMEQIVQEYNLYKVKWVIEGGQTAHDSTRNGVFFFKDKLQNNDFVVIHDAARPILPQAAINEMLDVASEKGNASLVIPCYETVLFTKDNKSGDKELDRNSIMRIQTPQAYKYEQILNLYEMAEKDNIHDFVYADIVAVHYGQPVYFSKGFTNNIKITRKEDIPLTKALLNFSEDELFNL